MVLPTDCHSRGGGNPGRCDGLFQYPWMPSRAGHDNNTIQAPRVSKGIYAATLRFSPSRLGFGKCFDPLPHGRGLENVWAGGEVGTGKTLFSWLVLVERLDGVFEHAFEVGEEGGADGAVDDAVVAGEGHGHG